MSFHLFIRTEDDIHYTSFEYEYDLVHYLNEYGYDLNQYEPLTTNINISRFPFRSYLLIKGKCVIPKPEQVVTRWNFNV